MLELILAAVAATTVAASAQSFNIEWGTPETAPPASYGAQGLPGVWNTLGSMTPSQRYNLVGLDGQPIAADIMNIGFDIIESFDNPTTVGDDAALLDDCFTSFNDPIDGCLFMRFLQPGDYRVIMYALAPDDEALESRLRIDQNTEDPEFVGGAWSGAHENGISFMMQNATVGDDGRLDIHSGLLGGNIRSVLNGIQVIRLADLCAADLDFNGTLDIFDV
ncbi:MAG: hypothetical protein KC996_12160, partial [Phycisphaerales bacterium]|nr:hypothetical protein [Phycisphaerales bacterium]